MNLAFPRINMLFSLSPKKMDVWPFLHCWPCQGSLSAIGAKKRPVDRPNGPTYRETERIQSCLRIWGHGGDVIQLSWVRPSPKNGGYVGVAGKKVDFQPKKDSVDQPESRRAMLSTQIKCGNSSIRILQFEFLLNCPPSSWVFVRSGGTLMHLQSKTPTQVQVDTASLKLTLQI